MVPGKRNKKLGKWIEEIETKTRNIEPGNRIKNQKYRTSKQKQNSKIREPEATEKCYKQGPMN